MNGAPEGTRTPNLRLRRPALYPIELRALYSLSVHTELYLINLAVRGSGAKWDYQRLRRPPPRPPRSRPPPPPTRSALGRASFTFNVRPAS
jgi:hypothetical protein